MDKACSPVARSEIFESSSKDAKNGAQKSVTAKITSAPLKAGMRVEGSSMSASKRVTPFALRVVAEELDGERVIP